MHIPNRLQFKTSSIADGNMSFRFGDKDEVTGNRQQFVGHDQYVCMQCTHGAEIVTVDKPVADHIEAEVLVTQTPNLALLLLTADCLPAAFFDPITGTIVLAHFSRETIADGLPQKTVGFLRQTYDINPADLQVFVGPHISADSYCFPAPLDTVRPLIASHLITHHDNVCIDLPAAHTAQLTEVGVQKGNILYSEVDTFHSPEHFSHFESTRDDTKPHGRLITSLTLLP
jgi:copper oxidase (laccase) domain-containing protein